MAKLWCPLCKRSSFNTSQASQVGRVTQQDINAHLLSAHNHTITPRNENWYRQLQNRRWEAQNEALDLKLRQNTRNKQIEWEAFAENARIRNVPSTTGLDEQLLREMVWLNEIADDSDSEDTEDREVHTTPDVEEPTTEKIERGRVHKGLGQQSRPRDKEAALKPAVTQELVDRNREGTEAAEKERVKGCCVKELAAFQRDEVGGR